MKLCSKCGTYKHLDEFHRHGAGVRPDCKICVLKRTRATQWTRTEYLRGYRQGHRDAIRLTNSRAKKSAPEKNRARRALARAVQSNAIPKPASCERCGGQRPEAHHRDYAKPLEVLWLCRRCHGLEHRSPA